MLEKFYSVAVEMDDGHRKTLAVKGRGSGQAFAHAKATPGVRRVGKVTEVDAADFAHVSQGGTLKEKPAGSHRDKPGATSHKSDAHRKASAHPKTDAHHPSEKAPAEPAARPAASAPYSNTGPRIVSHARTRTGEQPFKHLQAPPERPKPPAPVAKAHAPVKAAKARAGKAVKPAKVAKPKAAKTPAKKSAATASDKARIVKSRRQDGPAYLVQQGTWKEVGGNRVFTVESETGFDTREAAEAALA